MDALHGLVVIPTRARELPERRNVHDVGRLALDAAVIRRDENARSSETRRRVGRKTGDASRVGAIARTNNGSNKRHTERWRERKANVARSLASCCQMLGIIEVPTRTDW